jgi:hypothetical protein
VTKINLDEIEARAKAATPGPWTVCPMDMYIFGGDGHMIASNCPMEDTWQVRGAGAEGSGQRPEGSQDANAAFIAAAREDIPRLIAEVRRLQAQVNGEPPPLRGRSDVVQYIDDPAWEKKP